MPAENERVEETAKPVVPERVLIVEDDPATRVGLAELVRAWGFQTEEAANGEEAMDKITSFRPAIIVSDLVMPRMGGLELLRVLKDQLSDLTIILLTAQGTVESAVEAIKEGAYDYLTKPVDPARLRVLLQKAVERQETLREVQHLRRQLREQGSFGRFVGNSPSIRAVYRLIEQAAPTSASVLIWGESGTGKELAAQTIHELSPRSSFPFVAINCAAIPETLLESEIFGHEKGAFTGATASRPGKFENAEGGTLFLDEVGDVSPSIQSKLLRAIEQKEVMRVGGSQVIHADVRIIAATNQDLKGRVEAKAFREDLYYRLNVFNIVVPPLRERREDIPKLCDHFLALIGKENGVPPKRLSPAALKSLLACRWPGNARQLRNALETATLVSQGDTIEPGDLPPEVTQAVLPPTAAEPIPLPASRTLGEMEREAIRAALAETGGNKTQAAKLLGIGLRTLHRKVKEYGID